MACCGERTLKMVATHFIALPSFFALIAIFSFTAVFSLTAMFSVPATAQQSSPATAPLTAAQIDQLVAPIALYPDPIVAQILTAATYPLEVVEADRWLRQPANAALTGDALTAALQREPWDPSVKSLIALRLILNIMDADLDWTERLGDAFLAQPSDVMDAIQHLRRRAEAAGTLVTTPQQAVSSADEEIEIEPANPDVLYVPSYDPSCIYGSWPYPDEPPYYFGTGSDSCTPADSVMDFDDGIYPPFGFWAWGSFDWRRHQIRIDRDRYERFHTGNPPAGDIWQHDPVHRHGVPYRNPETARRFEGTAAPDVRVIRGFGPSPREPSPTEVAPRTAPRERPAIPSAGRAPLASPSGHPAPPAYESFGRGVDVRGEAARGFSSRMAPPAPMPSFHAAPAPSFNAAPAPSFPPSFHGGGGFGGRR